MGDQPQAIAQLVKGIQDGAKAQVLQGVTGSGKTFTIANVIQQLNKPTLVMSHIRPWRHNYIVSLKIFFQITQ